MWGTAARAPDRAGMDFNLFATGGDCRRLTPRDPCRSFAAQAYDLGREAQMRINGMKEAVGV